MGDWIKYTQGRLTMEYYLAFEKKEILSHATTRMSPWGFMLSETGLRRANYS